MADAHRRHGGEALNNHKYTQLVEARIVVVVLVVVLLALFDRLFVVFQIYLKDATRQFLPKTTQEHNVV